MSRRASRSSTPAVIASLLVSLAGCGDPSAGGSARPPAPPPAATRNDPYGPLVRVPPVSGEPVRVRHDVSGGLVLRSKGTVAFRQKATGKFGAGGRKPSRSFEGTVDLVRRIEPLGGARVSNVTGTLALVGRNEDAPRKEVSVPFSLTFDETGNGAAVVRTIRLSAPGLEPADLEALQRAFTDRFAPPDRPVRVGDSWKPGDGIDVEEPLKRVVFKLFIRTMAQFQPMVAAPQGAVWVDGREGTGPDAVLVLRAAVAHFHEGDSDKPPLPKENVHIAYEAAIEGTRKLVIDGGWASAHDVAYRRRIRFTTPPDVDYTVETESRATLTTTRDAK